MRLVRLDVHVSNDATVPVSGTQHILTSGPYRAVIASVGASLRVLEHDGRPLVTPFGEDDVRPGYRGAVLVPWPNRVVDGHYYVDGRTYALSLTEPERGHALHGLGAWAEWTTDSSDETSVTLSHTIAPQAGYPFRVRCEVTYALSGDGLSWSVRATNVGTGRAPYGTGPHPYLVAGPEPVDEWEARIPAEQVLTVTPDRLIPIGVADVATYDGGRLDFRTPRVVGSTFIDHAYTGLVLEGGTGRVEVRSPSGTGVAMEWDAGSPWLQVHTPEGPGDAFRSGLAVEPMTCPPDAFNSRTDLVLLEPGESHEVGWRIVAL